MTKYLMIILVAVSVCFAGCGKKEGPKPKEEAPAAESAGAEDQVKHKILAFNLEGLSEKGTKKWDVKGESAEAVSENEIKMDNIVAKAYGDEAQAVITADKGIYDKGKNNVKLEQNVKAVIENSQGFAKDFVDMPQEGAGGANTKTPDADKGPKKTTTVITCDGEVRFEYEKNRAYFTNNVRVVSEDGSIDADLITLYLNPETKKVNEIVAEGNVKITRGDNVTYSDRATYVEADKKVVLEGRPKIIIYQEGEFQTNFLSDSTKK